MTKLSKATVTVFGLCLFLSFSHIRVNAQDTPTPVPTAEVTATPVPPPDTTPIPAPTDPAQSALQLVLAFVVGLESLMVVVKPALRGIADRFEFSDEAYDALVKGIAVFLGIFGVLASNQQLNIFLGFPQLPPLLGTILTGAAAAGGAGLVHVVFDFANGAKAVQNAKVLTAYTSTPAKVYVPTIQVNEPTETK